MHIRLSVALLGISLFAQDATAPKVSPDDRAVILLAQRDTLSVVMQAQQMVQAAQKRESDAIAKVEAKSGCKIDPRTADCMAKK